ncbi:MAG: PKD domain-containing protein [Methanoregulaceae archaeon]|nr:PKD domain-containing protein [Methanoregulaceae archaeon]
MAGQVKYPELQKTVGKISWTVVLAVVTALAWVALPTSAVDLPDADFTADVTSGDAPLAIYFTDTSTGDPVTWAWSFGDGGSAITQNPVHTFVTPGTYSITLQIRTRGGMSDQEFKTGYITVTDPDRPTATPTGTTTSSGTTVLNASFSGTPLSGGSPLDVTFTDSSTGSPDTWSWDFGDGQQSKQQNPSHTYSVPGRYSVWLTVFRDNDKDVEKRMDYITVTEGSVVTGGATPAVNKTQGEMILIIETPGPRSTSTSSLTRPPTTRETATQPTSRSTTAAPPAAAPSAQNGIIVPLVIVVIIGSVLGAAVIFYQSRQVDELD